MICAKLLAVACVARSAQALMLGVRQDLADSPLGAAFPTPLSPLSPPRIGPLPSVSVVFTTPTPTATPTATRSSPSSGVTSDPSLDDSSPGTGSGTPTDMPTIPGGSTAPTSLIVLETDSPIHDHNPLDSSSPSSNRTLVITLSSVLSSVGLLLLLGAFFLLYRIKTRGGRKPLFARGISPIDDDEIATWKVPHSEKSALPGEDEETPNPSPPQTAAAAPTTPSRTHTKSQPSTSSLRKPPSAVIVYSNPHGQHHRRCSSADSYSYSYSPPNSGGSTTRKMSFDKILPQTPIQARAPNAIPGLTDESVPGAMPFLPPVDPVPQHHHQRRLSKVRSAHHVRARSSRSGSFGLGGQHWGDGGGGEGRHSHDYVPRGYGPHGHWRMGSDLAVGSTPATQGRGKSFEGWAGEGEIGRAIG